MLNATLRIRDILLKELKASLRIRPVAEFSVNFKISDRKNWYREFLEKIS